MTVSANESREKWRTAHYDPVGMATRGVSVGWYGGIACDCIKGRGIGMARVTYRAGDGEQGAAFYVNNLMCRVEWSENEQSEKNQVRRVWVSTNGHPVKDSSVMYVSRSIQASPTNHARFKTKKMYTFPVECTLLDFRPYRYTSPTDTTPFPFSSSVYKSIQKSSPTIMSVSTFPALPLVPPLPAPSSLAAIPGVLALSLRAPTSWLQVTLPGHGPDFFSATEAGVLTSEFGVANETSGAAFLPIRINDWSSSVSWTRLSDQASVSEKSTIMSMSSSTTPKVS